VNVSYRALLLTGLVALLVPVTASAKRRLPSADSLVGVVSANQLLVNNLAADIEREISTGDSNTASLTGKFYWQYPKFRLDVTRPKEMHMVFDGQRLLTRVPSEKELRVKEVSDQAEFEASGETPWLPSLTAYRSKYDFKLVGQGPIEGKDVWVLEGKAQDSSSAVQRVMIWIDKSNADPLRLETYGNGAAPTSIYLVDSLEEVDSIRVPVQFQTWAGLGESTLHTTTTFSRVRVNSELDEELFRVNLPGKSGN
jgi:outer membrane lipoprotein-sorting protein